ncbi:MAG: Uma2 family endonuclease [Cyanobacteriota bacterium]|nr:Uma2 family endonuclease [Cyanobacteriota bacterium]
MNPSLLEQSGSKSLAEQRLVLYGISWQQYEILRQTLEEVPGTRMVYLEGTLEIMTPSPEHESAKATIGTLLDVYLIQKGIRFYKCGSPTLKNQDKVRGKEPDESYNLGTKKDIPDLAIEVVVSSGSLDILSVYQGLGVPEVWLWKNNQLSIYHLRSQGYEQISKSELLPELDLALLVKYLIYPDQYDAIIEFRNAIA